MSLPRRQPIAVALAWFLMVAALVAIPAPPAHASAFVDGEAWVSDDWISAWDLSNGQDNQQGYNRWNAADFHYGNKPDCALATGRTPSGYADSQVPGGVVIKENTAAERGPSTHTVIAYKSTSSYNQEMGVDYTYWVHAARDFSGDSTTICQHTTVTTDVNGNFSVSFPRSLGASPAMVTWSAAQSGGGCTQPCVAIGNVVTSKSSSGFEGRAYAGGTTCSGLACGRWLSTKTFEIDYLAVTDAHSDLEDYGNGLPYEHVAGVATVTTDSNGNATIDHADLNSGQAMSGQVTGWGTINQLDNLAGDIILGGITPTSSTIHARKENGSSLASTTIDVSYIIFGYTSGSPRPQWGSQGMRQVDGEQINGAECTGASADADDICYRLLQEEESASYQYELAGSLQSTFGNIDGQSWVNISDTVRDAINNADVDLPSFVRDATPEGTEPFYLAAGAVPLGAQGLATVDYNDYTDDGLNLITDIAVELDMFETHWSTDDDLQNGYYNAHGVLAHEILHGMGYGHADGSASIMYGGGSMNYGVIPFLSASVENLRGIYGYSSSIWAPGEPRLSTLAKTRKGQSVGLVTVGAPTGNTRLLYNRIRQVEVSVTSPETWAGAGLPATIWVHHRLADEMTSGSRWWVRALDGTRRAIEAQPVVAGQVQLDPDRAEHAIDDVGDAGARNQVSVAKLRPHAGLYVKPTGQAARMVRP